MIERQDIVHLAPQVSPQMSPHLVTLGHLAFGGVLIALLIGHVVLFFGALVSVLASREPALPKLLWIVLVFAAPFVGALVWFLFGRQRTRDNAYRRGY